MSKQKALKVLKKFDLGLDGPYKSAYDSSFSGTIDAPGGQSFNGQFRSIAISAYSMKEFWSNVIGMAELDGPELCDDEREEI